MLCSVPHPKKWTRRPYEKAALCAVRFVRTLALLWARQCRKSTTLGAIAFDEMSRAPGRLPDAGRSALLVQRLEGMNDYDLYDVLAELGYGVAPRTRVERAEAFAYKHDRWLAGLPAPVG